VDRFEQASSLLDAQRHLAAALELTAAAADHISHHACRFRFRRTIQLVLGAPESAMYAQLSPTVNHETN